MQSESLLPKIDGVINHTQMCKDYVEELNNSEISTSMPIFYHPILDNPCDHRYVEKEMQVEGCPIRMWLQCKFCGDVPDNMTLIPSHAYVGLELIDPYYAPENKRKRLD